MHHQIQLAVGDMTLRSWKPTLSLQPPLPPPLRILAIDDIQTATSVAALAYPALYFFNAFRLVLVISFSNVDFFLFLLIFLFFAVKTKIQKRSPQGSMAPHKICYGQHPVDIVLQLPQMCKPYLNAILRTANHIRACLIYLLVFRQKLPPPPKKKYFNASLILIFSQMANSKWKLKSQRISRRNFYITKSGGHRDWREVSWNQSKLHRLICMYILGHFHKKILSI